MNDKSPSRELSDYDKLRADKIKRNNKVIKNLKLKDDLIGKPIVSIVSKTRSIELHPNLNIIGI